MFRNPGVVGRAANRFFIGFIAIGFVAVLLGGCSRNEPVDLPVHRAVKVEAVGEAQEEGMFFTGVVRQRQRADLSFESSGRLVALGVDVGDVVQKGQVLAALDGEPLRLRLKQAQASARSSQAQAAERQGNYLRQQRLYAAGSVAQSIVESAKADYDRAEAQERRADSDLALAQRIVKHGQLLAPFTGRIVSRRANRYSQLTQGQVVLELESSDDRQVIASVTQAQAERLKPGDAALAYASSQPLTSFDLMLEGVSQRAENGLLQTCIFRLRNPSANLPSGSPVLVQLNGDARRHLSIPMSALSMGMTVSSAKVFVYGPDQGKVTLRNVSITGIEQGRALIDTGLAKGELVVTAGVAFLSDGDAVSLYQPLTRLVQN